MSTLLFPFLQSLSLHSVFSVRQKSDHRGWPDNHQSRAPGEADQNSMNDYSVNSHMQDWLYCSSRYKNQLLHFSW